MSPVNRGILFLSIATLIWGSTFVVIKGGLHQTSPQLFNFVRFSIALLPFIWFLRFANRKTWTAGLELGFYAWIAYACQTTGLQFTTASKSAFVTTLYVVLLPVLLGLLGHRLSWKIWFSALLAILGVALLSLDGTGINQGDIWTLGTAISYTFYIWRMEKFSKTLPPEALTGIQMAIMAILFGLGAWINNDISTFNFFSFPWISAVYLGLAASALCIWLQTLGQQVVSSTQSSVLYALEPVWASLFAFLFLGERFGVKGWLGASLVLFAVLASSFEGNRQQKSTSIPS